jgi:hypothetical protein
VNAFETSRFRTSRIPCNNSPLTSDTPGTRSTEVTACCHVSSPWMLPILFRISELCDPCDTSSVCSNPRYPKSRWTPDLLHVSSRLDGQIVLGLTYSRSQKTLPLLFPGVRIPEMGDLVTCVLLQMDGSDLFRNFHYEGSRPLIIRTSEILNSRTLKSRYLDYFGTSSVLCSVHEV